MENRFKPQVSRLFHTSSMSCTSRTLSDIIENAVVNRRKFFPVELMAPKARLFPSICRPGSPEATENLISRHDNKVFDGNSPSSAAKVDVQNFSGVKEKAVVVPRNRRNVHLVEPISSKARLFPSICRPGSLEATKNLLSDQGVKVSDKSSPFLGPNIDGRTCPPASPISPLKPLKEKKENSEKSDQGKKKRKKKKKKTQRKKKNKEAFLSSYRSAQIASEFGGAWWYSSEDDDDEAEDETEPFFSSKTLSSDSSDSRRRHRSPSKNQGFGWRRASDRSSDVGKLAIEGKVKDSFAVVKKSNDPYNDFKTSMVEMIVEKQIFAAKDLEHLLQCFLSLNSPYHHKVIVQVFSEIWEALFSDLRF